VRIATLKKRAEFLRVRGGGHSGTPAFVLEGKARHVNTVPEHRGANSAETHAASGPDREEATSGVAGPRFGFTITKKLGNSVARSRMRRRLKAVISQIGPLAARRDWDYVILARRSAIDRAFELLVEDMRQAFGRVHQGPGRRARRNGAKKGGGSAA